MDRHSNSRKYNRKYIIFCNLLAKEVIQLGGHNCVADIQERAIIGMLLNAKMFLYRIVSLKLPVSSYLKLISEPKT